MISPFVGIVLSRTLPRLQSMKLPVTRRAVGLPWISLLLESGHQTAPRPILHIAPRNRKFCQRSIRSTLCGEFPRWWTLFNCLPWLPGAPLNLWTPSLLNAQVGSCSNKTYMVKQLICLGILWPIFHLQHDANSTRDLTSTYSRFDMCWMLCPLQTTTYHRASQGAACWQHQRCLSLLENMISTNDLVRIQEKHVENLLRQSMNACTHVFKCTYVCKCTYECRYEDSHLHNCICVYVCVYMYLSLCVNDQSYWATTVSVGHGHDSLTHVAPASLAIRMSFCFQQLAGLSLAKGVAITVGLTMNHQQWQVLYTPGISCNGLLVEYIGMSY